jgi:hypothetical protein
MPPVRFEPTTLAFEEGEYVIAIFDAIFQLLNLSRSNPKKRNKIKFVLNSV